MDIVNQIPDKRLPREAPAGAPLRRSPASLASLLAAGCSLRGGLRLPGSGRAGRLHRRRPALGADHPATSARATSEERSESALSALRLLSRRQNARLLVAQVRAPDLSGRCAGGGGRRGGALCTALALPSPEVTSSLAKLKLAGRRS